MKLIQPHRLTLAILLSVGCAMTTVSAAEHIYSCVDVSALYSEISAESEEWQRARLDASSEPTSACEELKLGLLLSHPIVSFQNDSEALDALSHALLVLPDDAVNKAVLSMTIDHIEERQTLRNMLGKSQRQLRYRQQQINTLRGQINQLKNLEAQLEDKARAAIAPEPDETLDFTSEASEPTIESTTDEATSQESKGE